MRVVLSYGEQCNLLSLQEFAETRAQSLEAQGREAAEAGDWKRACELQEQAREAAGKALLAREIICVSMALQKFREARACEAAEAPAPGTGPKIIAQAPTAPRRARRRERRPGTARRRSSARSGDSPDSDPEPPAVDPWRWVSRSSWESFVASVGRSDFEAEVALERWSR